MAEHPDVAKSCPFCGATPKPALRRLGSTYTASFAVVCAGCRAQGPLKRSQGEAVYAWNRAKARIEELEAFLRGLANGIEARGGDATPTRELLAGDHDV